MMRPTVNRFLIPKSNDWNLTRILAYVVKRNNTFFYVYDGTRDGVPTKLITREQWDGKLCIQQSVNGKECYKDTKGNEIYVYEENEDDFNEW